MPDQELDFLQDQRGKRKMFCENFVDRKWSETTYMRRKDVQSLDRIRKSDAIEELNLNTTVELSSESFIQSSADIQSSAETSEFSEEPEIYQSKKRKLNFD